VAHPAAVTRRASKDYVLSRGSAFLTLDLVVGVSISEFVDT
jgi:hypothetical protein